MRGTQDFEPLTGPQLANEVRRELRLDPDRDFGVAEAILLLELAGMTVEDLVAWRDERIARERAQSEAGIAAALHGTAETSHPHAATALGVLAVSPGRNRALMKTGTGPHR